jgi:regulator of protease activity HflC (stomatin/prohibitin superfamily)
MLHIVLFILFIASLVYFIFSKKGISIDGNVIVPASTLARKISLGFTVLFFLLLTGAVKIIPSDSRGLRFTFGAIANEELAAGLHFAFPLVQHIELVTIQPIEVTTTVTVDSNGAITKDNQTIGAELALFYIYNQGSLPLMWKEYGEEKLKSIIQKSKTEAFKAQIGRYDIFSLPTSQDSIRIKTLKQIKMMLSAYPVTITELKITNYDWSDDFDNQIKQTMNRSQEVKQKEQELLITEQEAQKKVKNAEADKQALVTASEGERIAAENRAEAKALEGEGIRKFNESVAKNMSLEIELRKLKIEEIKAEKWDGRYVPNNHYGPIPVQTNGYLQPIQTK